MNMKIPYVVQMPAYTGETLYLLDDCTLYLLDENFQESDGIKVSEFLLRLFFETGVLVLAKGHSVQRHDGCEEDEVDEVAEDVGIACTDETVGAIASDGRSSTYYDIGLPNWLIARVLERYEDGRAYIKTEELIEVAFNDDFDAGNALKSLVRLWGAFNYAGKAGNSVSYEKNKIEYSVGKLEQRFERKSGPVEW